MATQTDISVNNIVKTYQLFNATDIKDFIISQLKDSDNEIFKDCSYIGSNMNAFIDVLAVMLQQILFHFSLQSSEATFSSASLYESMVKLVSILNYKPIGKQTSMLPVRLSMTVDDIVEDKNEAIFPRFLTVEYNYQYVLKNSIIKQIDTSMSEVDVETIMYQGSLLTSPVYTAIGDEFETIILEDNYYDGGEKFISDNFFVVYVKDVDTGKYYEYTETASLFQKEYDSKCYEKRFNEQHNYEFKFGNGIYGKKLKAGDEIVIYYILSNGENGIVDEDTIKSTTPSSYSSVLYNDIIETQSDTIDTEIYSDTNIGRIKVIPTGGSTAVSYPESVDSIRNNAPKMFSSQGRLFSKDDYHLFIKKNFRSYCSDSFIMTNDEYISNYLKYYFQLGFDAPQKDSRVALSQVEFQSSCGFNNIYCVLLPQVNPIIDGKIPSYVSTGLKQEIVNECEDYKVLTHNVVPIDPIYRAVTFGSYRLQQDKYNKNQLKTKLIVRRKTGEKYSLSYIKEKVVNVITTYFSNLKLGDNVSISDLDSLITEIPGVKNYYLYDSEGNTQEQMSLYYWNPQYQNEDNGLSQQTLYCEGFMKYYFYDSDNITSIVEVQDE